MPESDLARRVRERLNAEHDWDWRATMTKKTQTARSFSS